MTIYARPSETSQQTGQRSRSFAQFFGRGFAGFKGRGAQKSSQEQPRSDQKAESRSQKLSVNNRQDSRQGIANVTIPDGENRARTSRVDGQQFNLGRGASTAVDGAPVLTASNNRVAFNNQGSASTTGATNTIQLDGNNGQVNNGRGAQIAAEGTGVAISGQNNDVNNRGSISGDVNAVNFVNGGQSSGNVNNSGTISSDSRGVNIGGDGINVNNSGSIVGTGDQRNGTVYTDATSNNTQINNGRNAVIDAGAGNSGAGVVFENGDTPGAAINSTLNNQGTIAGRGQAAADVGLAGDGVRIFSPVDGTSFNGNINNSGSITSESNVGPTAGFRVADGVAFNGQVNNNRSGTISGANNGVYFGEGAHDAQVNNSGTISSDSRAVNIDGTGVQLRNSGTILGTGDQRNGTVYSDSTADNFSVDNNRSGVIDAGKGNAGAGVALQTGSEAGDVVNADLRNSGSITGRGQAPATEGTAGDGVRIFAGAEGGTTFQGDVTNSGSITSESNVGPTAGFRVADGVGFDGTLTNNRSGTISGANNGVYFGEGAHDAQVNNSGTISSDSRAVNIDGTGVDVVNSGRIIGTGDQRNGTVYADNTADDFSVTNTRTGRIDAGRGNNGSGVSLQSGDVDGDVVSGSIRNDGKIKGRGDAAEGNTVGDGVRLFSDQANVTVQGNIENTGRIIASRDSNEAAGVSIESGIALDGQIINRGTIRANETAIDATDAGGSVNVVNAGRIKGDVNLSAGDDVFNGAQGRTNGVIRGGEGNDTIIGGRGIDTAAYDDIDVSVTVDLEAGTATRETGFSLSSENQPLTSLTTDQTPAQLVDEAAAGNFYYNVHTTEFNGGEIRGQLIPVSDLTDLHGVRTLTLNANLDAAQEPGPLSTSAATGQGSVIITQNGDIVLYNSTLHIQGIESSELMPVAGVSAIHLHNAPAGQNGPVITDIVQDAGGDINGAAQSASADTGDGDVFNEVIEVDYLESIERIIGSDDGVTFVGGRTPADNGGHPQY